VRLTRAPVVSGPLTTCRGCATLDRVDLGRLPYPLRGRAAG
jgi:hypothetical protein